MCHWETGQDKIRKSNSRFKYPLELVHSDVCGPMETESFGGSRYFVTFIDDCTRKVHLYCLKNKSQVFATFKKYKQEVETTTDRKIKALRTDNGAEYTNTEFKKYLEECGIIHQTTVPYNPEQNGASERINRTIVERARCMLIDAGLSTKYWAEAVNTAVYLGNRSPNRSIAYQTPEQMWTGKVCSLKHLKVFGSRCVIQIPKQKRKKWDPVGQSGILVGYASTSKAYRIMLPDNKVVASRSVKFFENFDGPSAKKDNVVFLECNENNEDNDDIRTEEEAPEVVELRRSSRPHKPNQHPDFAYVSEPYTPQNFKDAIQSVKGPKWPIYIDKTCE